MIPISNSTKQLKIAAIISYSVIIFNILAGFVYTPWMISVIGISDYGLYVLATSFLAYFVLDFGLGQSVTRFIAKYRAENSEENIYNFLGLTFKLYLIFAFIILITLIVIYCLIDKIFIQLTAVEVKNFKILFVLVGLFSIFSFPFKPIDGIISGYELFVPLQICNLLNKVLTIALVILALFFGLGLYSLVFSNIIAGIILIIVKLIIIKKNTTIKVNYKYINKSMAKNIFSFSGWMTVNIILYNMLVSIQPTILGMFSGSNQISIFSIGMVLFGYTNTFVSALSGLFLPKVSRIVKMEDAKEKVEELTIKVGRIQLTIIGAIVVIFTSIGKNFIELWVGKFFNNSYIVALLLILPLLITSTQTILRTMIVAQGKVKLEAIGLIFSAITSVTVSLILSNGMGAVGAALGSSIGIIFSYIIWMNIIYHKVLGVSIYRFFKECHFKFSVPIIVSILIGYLFKIIIPSENIIEFIIKATLVGSVYVLLIWMFALNNYEKNIIISPLKLVHRMILK
ncbi:lipopolysaccharide biosynthesis protein [Paenibacillus cremeus]|uniref:Oligosaccharide flippase family protein n=1 Tax=Paenibacillus cremeus TaxID=2163881 RepID=A0A559K4Z4_9BACL|nr:oligosaccharide flippase family protein [Paenibacillus cremeus]TVY07215.1 oligosaccharide flippase family protein [Paenibacillus cremeus]